ncbi:MAG: WG repeat-containing protein [Bacteroides sp.]|nr:WG repeat-containing protein [Barnesiella sp.]MBD5254179.1 WG repeat-containing protein [Barnesiella sp.]MBD5344021.1 WG repeat-containing protein [Bacteroides sp.]MBD5367676.1 WG repeat-containing protein [Bacteroides sp.]MDE5829385.1 WG repeat-containing protein [Duncaniella sp.]
MKHFILSLLLLASGLSVWAEYPRPSQAVNGKYGYYSSTGNVEIRPRYDNALDFREGFAPVEIRGKWGFINLQGRTIAKCQYQEVRNFNYGYAVVRKDNKWGVIDTDGKEVVPCVFDDLGQLSDVTSVVKKYTPVVGEQALQLQQDSVAAK